MKKAVLFTIIIVALLLRTYKISKIPPSLSWDEVSIGYNAYSILKTGRDEHGKFLPYDSFAAYGDYKPPFAIYATVPFVAAFGLNELAVRLPSAIFGTLTVLMTYFLVAECIPAVALLGAAILAISPWHINISRGGFEANIALFFAVLGIWCVLKARNNARYWLFAWLPFTAAVYTFNSSRIFTVLFAPALVIFTWHAIKKNLRLFFSGIFIAFLVLLPILPHLVSKEARLRFSEVNIFTDVSVVETSNARIAREPGSIIGAFVNNRRIGYARSYLLHFFDNLRPRFLFVTGDGNPKFSIQDVGQLYMIEAPFLVIGILSLFSQYPAVSWLLLYWLVAAIVPAAAARETPHALRILNSLPTWHIFVAFGIFKSIQYIKKNWFIVFIVFLYSFSIIYYLHTYYRHYPIEYSSEWQYGYREALARVAPIESKYDRVVITDSIGRPYMYTLFYTKTHPNDLFRTVHAYVDAAGFYHVDGFLKYSFGGKLPDILDSRTLYVWDAGAVPKSAHVIDTIRLLNGIPVLTIFDI